MTPEWERYASGQTYLEVERMLTKFARQTATRFQIDMAEAMSAAGVGFMKAFHSFRPELGFEFTTWCGEKVKRHLQNLVQKHIEQANRPLVQVDDLTAAPTKEPAVFDLDGFLEVLSDDARQVVRLVFDTPTDVRVSMWQIGKDDPEAFRSAVREFLDDQGWSKRRIKRAFLEIRSKL